VCGSVEFVEFTFEDAIEFGLGERLELFGEVDCGCRGAECTESSGVRERACRPVRGCEWQVACVCSC